MSSRAITPTIAPAEAGGRLSGPAIVAGIATAKLCLHLLTASRYGPFRDEIYYVACSEHLGAGYVDHPPLIAFLTWFARHAFGDSLFALRLLPAVAGAGLVMLTGALAREMGGGRFAQAMAALAVLFVPYYLILQHWMTMNAFEPLIWAACAWCVVRAINTENPRFCLLFGLLAGVGLENKYSIAFFLVGVVAGLLATPARHFFRSRWFWMGVGTSIAIFIPNLVWLIRHGFPFLELMHNVRMSGRDVTRPPLAFLADQALVHNPLLFPLWAGGLLWLLAAAQGRRYRVLGIAFLFVFGALMLLKGKNYYVSPVYPMLFAAGSVAFEGITKSRWKPARYAYAAAVIIFSLIIMPIMVPILPVASYVEYQRFLSYPPPQSEHQPNGVLPQYFADEFGWEEMARVTAAAFYRLSPEDREKAVIFANNYGDAAAIDFYGPGLGLPRAVCPHQSYWLWEPQKASGDVFLVLGSDGTGDREHFATVEAAGRVEHPYSRLDEHFTLWLCRDLKFDLRQSWPGMKRWH
jgi:4-amino-4-deoxy-L-arabinose transferase-like glycosyltransferase